MAFCFSNVNFFAEGNLFFQQQPLLFVTQFVSPTMRQDPASRACLLRSLIKLLPSSSPDRSGGLDNRLAVETEIADAGIFGADATDVYWYTTL